MTRHRFFIPPENFSGEVVQISPEICSQITKVLRLKVGDQVEFLDNQGSAYQIALEKDAAGVFSGRVLSRSDVNTEPSVCLTLYLGLTQREKLEWILQKGTEIGVSAFQPFISKRTLVREKGTAEKKRSRRQSILREAAEQSGRGRIPELGEPLRFAEALDQSLDADDLTLACWVHEKHTSLGGAFGTAKPKRVGLFTGPEGGFAPEETDLMFAKGVRMVSLGKRVLRMETAAILAPALVLYALGEMSAGSE